MRLSKLLKGIEGAVIDQKNRGDIEISSLCTDSRRAAKGCLFFCLTGGKRDAHAYARDAVAKGAAAIVVERELPVDAVQILVKDSRLALGLLSSVFFGEPSNALSVVGVTGTNGKTTTTRMLSAIFEEAGKRVGVIGTLGISYGGKEYPSSLTTPDPIFLQETLADMRSCGVEYVFMEVSAHALHYRKTAGVRFSACIFTSLTQDHLDFFPSMKEYGEAKKKLFSADICPIAVVNGDDPFGREIGDFRQNKGVKTVYYGMDTPVDAFAVLLDENGYGTECMCNFNDKLCLVGLSMTGRHNVYNALAAGACAVELGLPVATVARGLSKLKGVKGRLERIASYRGGAIYVDFAHTPDGLQKSLQSLRPHCQGKLVCLFGCGGNRDKSKRSVMGELAAKECDFAVLTSDNPRYEDPMDILSAIERGYRRASNRYVVVADRTLAIDYALDRMGEGDILLIAGKGGEEYQEIMGIKYPYNDHATVVRLLAEKGSTQS